MRPIELLDIQRLPIAGMDFPFHIKVVIGPSHKKIRHLVKTIVLVLAFFIVFAAGHDKT